MRSRAVFVLCAGLAAPALAQHCTPTWHAVPLNGEVNALFDDRAAARLLIGGAFTSPVPYLTEFSGGSLGSVGAGLDGQVLGITRHDDGSGSTLYVTGFVNVPLAPWTVCFGRLNAGVFTGFGPTTGPTAPCGPAFSYDLGHGPRFLTSGGFISPCSYTGQWNGHDWECLSQGLGSVAFDAAIFDDGSGPGLFLVGGFLVNDLPFEQGIGVGKWDGAAWHTVGGGIGDRNGQGFALSCIVFDDGSGPELFIAGLFERAGNAPVTNIAKWNGVRWAPLGMGTDGLVRALCPFDDGSGMKLYAAGDFTHAGGVAAQHLARWDGHAWSPCPAGGLPAGAVYTMKTHDPDGPGPQRPALFVGGNFTSVAGGALPAANLAYLAPAGGRADFNGDGFIDFFDLDAFTSAFESGDPSADFGGDGFIDFFDFADFVAAFEIGC